MKQQPYLLFILSIFSLNIQCHDEKFTPELNVSITNLTLSPLSNSKDSFLIRSNTEWKIISKADWLYIDPSLGKGDKIIYLSALENTDTIPRNTDIVVSAEGVEDRVIKVLQGGRLFVFPELINLDSTAHSEDTLHIVSRDSWTISVSEDWLEVSTLSGNGEGMVIIKTVKNNPDTAKRVATLTINSAKSGTQQVHIVQKGTVYFMNLSAKSIILGPEANNFATFEIESNTQWAITEPQNWLKVFPLSGKGKATITIQTKEKMTISRARSVNLTITGEYTKSAKVKVTQEGIPCNIDDESLCSVMGCNIISLPSYNQLSSNAFLPDPFTFLDGSKVTTKTDWICRRAEIAALAQEFEFGIKPCTPYSATTATFSKSTNTITVTVTQNEKTISFDCRIIYPTSGTPPYPAIIGIGYSFLNNTLLSNLGVAIIIFPNDQIAEQNNIGSRGKGKFYDLFCSNHSAGALIAWAWGVSRLIDALEKTPETNIDPSRIGVTGCSRNGKGALVAGAFDERIKLTIPQESGSGGAASWRVSDAQKKAGQNVQTLSQIVTENCWFRANFSQFSSSAEKLPFDHHMIMALCAPRALLVIENTWMEWLGNLSTWTTANAARFVWEALGVPDHMGFSQIGHSDHCGYPDVQIPELEAYVKKFLIGNGNDDTYIMKTDGNLTFDKEKWVNWSVPIFP